MNQPFDAFLLAGGYGTRLAPITNTIPKCLVNIQGKPLLSHWLDLLERADCQSVLINTHYLADQVEAFLATQHHRQIKFATVFEPQLLGTLGSLRKNRSFFTKPINFLAHADNVCTDPLKKLIDYHANSDPSIILSMYSFLTSTPSSCGIITTSGDGTIKSYTEKPPASCSRQANSAVYAFSQGLFNVIDELPDSSSDISSDLLPLLCNRMNAIPVNSYFADIGTIESLAMTNREQPFTVLDNEPKM